MRIVQLTALVAICVPLFGIVQGAKASEISGTMFDLGKGSFPPTPAPLNVEVEIRVTTADGGALKLTDLTVRGGTATEILTVSPSGGFFHIKVEEPVAGPTGLVGVKLSFRRADGLVDTQTLGTSEIILRNGQVYSIDVTVPEDPPRHFATHQHVHHFHRHKWFFCR